MSAHVSSWSITFCTSIHTSVSVTLFIGGMSYIRSSLSCAAIRLKCRIAWSRTRRSFRTLMPSARFIHNLVWSFTAYLQCGWCIMCWEVVWNVARSKIVFVQVFVYARIFYGRREHFSRTISITQYNPPCGISWNHTQFILSPLVSLLTALMINCSCLTLIVEQILDSCPASMILLE